MHRGWSAKRRIVAGTLVAGTLDLAASIGLTLYFAHRTVPEMLAKIVAAGPIPDARDWGTLGAALGIIVHYILMAIMVWAYVTAVDRFPALRRNWVTWGVIYGLGTYVVMNLIVLPLRFGTPLPPPPTAIFTQLFCHIFLVGLPIAWIARR